jgi:putative hydrolase of the HAD superfamily
MLPIVVFDIGQVLIRYTPGKALDALARRAKKAPWRARWAFARAGAHKLATGRIDPDDFTRALNQRLHTDLTPGDIRDLWGLDLPEPVDGMLDLLQQVAAHTRVALLSDTNPFHWEFMTIRFPPLARVPDVFLSFEVGVTKPDRRFFQAAEQRLRRDSVETGHPIVYFDDLPANVRGARNTGWDAHLFLSCPQAQGILRDRGLDL